LIDSSTDSVTVSMTWSGKQLTREYTVRKDAGRVHYLLYPSWRIEIPYEPIQVKLPNQAGLLSVDGIVLPSAASQSALQVVQVIQGFHRVGMQATALLDGTNADVDVSQSGDAVLLKGTLKPSVVGLAATSVKNAFNTCDAGRSQDCINHTYTAPNSDYIWVLNLPGYGQVDYTKYVLTLVGDPTANMNLIVEAETGKVTASGTCASKLTIDDSRTYNFKGDFEAVLTWHGDHFTSDVSSACDRDRA
jgi:hypothetical protein